ncbi:hypothetical protein ACN27F_31855 [Solwaraspora sp. WMMB335]|uniref:hypothetical protein n=1 Tax=Solwaraspora sp. WMMB335 TaxID=3404118 RepID=UPI003B9448D8
MAHPTGPLPAGPLAQRLGPLLPPERQATARLVEIRPYGHFVTYGIGVSLMDMWVPATARARVPVAASTSDEER